MVTMGRALATAPTASSVQFFSTLALLDPVDREALVDRHVLGRSYGEIARSLGCSIARVQQRIERGSRLMRGALLGSERHERAERAAPSVFWNPQT
jgi:DNA-directed RNA polymerase specialized sigma24 family protein